MSAKRGDDELIAKLCAAAPGLAPSDAAEMLGELGDSAASMPAGTMRGCNLADRRAQSMRFAGIIWKYTFHKSMDDRAVFCLLQIVYHPDDNRIANSVFSTQYCDVFVIRELWAVTWLHHGCITLQTSHTFAAALMATSGYAAMGEDIALPWRAFSVEIPTGLLDASGIEFRRILVTVCEFGASMVVEGRRIDGSSYCDPTRLAYDLKDLLFCDETDWMDDVAARDGDIKERALTLSRRLVVGLLYTMQYTTNFVDRTAKPARGKKQRSRGEPPHRTIIVGAPIKTDARGPVRDFLMGGRKAPPSVQVLVRGHFKRQASGLGRLERRVIWIQPYWRGPEDAPILVRPIHVDAAAG